MERLSLRNLSLSPHPLLAAGRFSIYHDARVKEIDAVNVSFDIDGIILVSR